MKNNRHEKNLLDHVIYEDLTSPKSEAYQKLQVNVELASIDKKNKVIGICSTDKGEGKSTTVANLAYVYAVKGFKVLLVDLDLRRPTVHYFFRVPNENGVVDYSVDKCTKEQLIQHGKENLDFICSGSKTPFPASVLESDHLAQLFQELREEYDYIFVDCPPVLVASDVAIVSKLIDGTIFVVKSGSTNKDAFREAMNFLDSAKVNVIGVVMTNVQKKGKSYGYYYSDYKSE